MFSCFALHAPQGKSHSPLHPAVQLTMTIGKSGTFGNFFFIKYGHRNSLKMNTLRYESVFAHIQDSWEE
jgi:hypothetical protein